MKKITITTIISLICVNVMAQDIPEERRKQINDYLKSQGMPALDSGFTLDNEKKSVNFQRPHRINRYDDNVKKFLEFEITAKHQYKQFAANNNPHSSHLRRTLEEFKPIMAYSYTGAPDTVITKHIGYAPYVTYVKDEGWAGGIHFFKNQELICRFSENNIKLSHASYKESADKVGNEVNGKHTMLAIVGNKDSGYMYDVQWFDSHFFRSLECAAPEDSSKIMPRVIQMATQIDAFQ